MGESWGVSEERPPEGPALGAGAILEWLGAAPKRPRKASQRGNIWKPHLPGSRAREQQASLHLHPSTDSHLIKDIV